MDTPFIHGRIALADASELIERFGDDAGFEAAARADAAATTAMSRAFATGGRSNG